jgi:hypothetical protein
MISQNFFRFSRSVVSLTSLFQKLTNSTSGQVLTWAIVHCQSRRPQPRSCAGQDGILVFQVCLVSAVSGHCARITEEVLEIFTVSSKGHWSHLQIDVLHRETDGN